jgi:hypothetical protein
LKILVQPREKIGFDAISNALPEFFRSGEKKFKCQRCRKCDGNKRYDNGEEFAHFMVSEKMFYPSESRIGDVELEEALDEWFLIVCRISTTLDLKKDPYMPRFAHM